MDTKIIKGLFNFALLLALLTFMSNCSTDDPSVPPPANTAPVITTTPVTGITQISATSGGNITSDGGSAVTARGVCWSRTNNPTINNNLTSEGSGTGSFISNLTNLTIGTTYYVRAYASNSVGTGYGSILTFSTQAANLPVITTDDPDTIGPISVITGGNITSDGGGQITARGVCWSKNQNPTVSDSHSTDGTGTGSFRTFVKGLTMSTTYYIRAYATNSSGTGYGAQKTFTTHSVLAFGDYYAGGYIFYLDGTGWHGMVVAPTDQSKNSSWGCSNKQINGSKGSSIGTGSSNSIAILTNCTDNDCAAKHCGSLILNGFDDWFLPSKDELIAIYTNLHGKGVADIKFQWCWSSTDYGYSSPYYYATMVNIGSGNSQQGGKGNRLNVRAARAF